MSQYGALTQMAAIGAQESNFMSDDPKDSIFIEPVKKITNYSKGVINMVPPGKVTWGSKFKIKIEREGDLLNNLYFQFTFPELDIKNCEGINSRIDASDNDMLKVVDYADYHILKSAKLYIGGQLIDELKGSHLLAEGQLARPNMAIDGLINAIETGSVSSFDRKIEEFTCNVSLNFWFCNNLKKALPLVALQYHDVELEVEINEFETSYNTIFNNIRYKINNGTAYTESAGVNYIINNENLVHPYRDLVDVKIIGTYIYLDAEDRKRIAQSEHKILITQHQHRECFLGSGTNHSTRAINLDFNHPVKDLQFYFYNKKSNPYSPNNFYYNNGEDIDLSKNVLKTERVDDYFYEDKLRNHILGEARILINGQPREDWKDAIFYNQIQPLETFHRKYIVSPFYLYSFNGFGWSETPVGSLNFSRIDNAQLQIRTNRTSYQWLKKFYNTEDMNKFNDENIKIFIQATNWNYLIIKGGLAGLAYNN